MIEKLQGFGDVLAFVGSIIGALIVGLTTFIIIRHDTKQYRDDKFDNTFFNLLNIFKEERNKDIKILLEQFLREIGELKYQIEQKTYDEKINAYLKNEKIVSHDVIDKIYKNVVEINNNYGNEVGNIFAYLIPISPLKKVVLKLKESPTYLDFKEFYDLVERQIDRNLMTQLDKIFEDINNEKEKIESEKIDFLEHEKNIKDEINIIGDKFHPDLGTYFRSFYIVIDSIIDNKSLDIERKRKYLRITRSVLSSSELLSIFYNAFYYEKGKRVGELLSPESEFYFFAKKEDLEDIKKDYDSNSMRPDSELTYFKYNSLFFGNLDLSKLIKNKGKIANKKIGIEKKKGLLGLLFAIIYFIILFFTLPLPIEMKKGVNNVWLGFILGMGKGTIIAGMVLIFCLVFTFILSQYITKMIPDERLPKKLINKDEKYKFSDGIKETLYWIKNIVDLVTSIVIPGAIALVYFEKSVPHEFAEGLVNYIILGLLPTTIILKLIEYKYLFLEIWSLFKLLIFLLLTALKKLVTKTVKFL